MRRIDSDNYILNNGKRVFTDGPPGTDIPASWLTAMQEETMAVIEHKARFSENAAGQPIFTSNNQMLLAIREMIKAATFSYSLFEDKDTTGGYGDLPQTITDLTALGSSPISLYIDTDVTLTANLTIPANIDIIIKPGVTVTYSNYTFTINSRITAAPNIAWLSGVDTGDFNDQIVFVDWWGLDEDAFDAAFAASRHVRMPETSSYTLSAVLATISDNGATLIGMGSGASVPKITYTPVAGNIIAISGDDGYFANFELFGPGPAAGGERALHITGDRNTFEGITASDIAIFTRDNGDGNRYIRIKGSTISVLAQLQAAGAGGAFYMQDCHVTLDSASANGAILIDQREVVSLTNCFLDGAWTGAAGAPHAIHVSNLGSALQYCRSLVLTGCTLTGFSDYYIRSEAVGTDDGGGEIQNMRCHVIGGRLEFEDKAYANELIKIDNKDAITLDSVAIRFPDLGGGGAWAGFIDDSGCDADARVTLNNTLVKTKTTFTSNSNASVVDFTEMTTDENGVLSAGSAIKEVEVDLGVSVDTPFIPDLNTGNSFLVEIDVAAAHVVNNAINGTTGQAFTITFKRTVVLGAPTIAWGANYIFEGGVAGIAPTTGAVGGWFNTFTFRMQGTQFIEESRVVDAR